MNNETETCCGSEKSAAGFIKKQWDKNISAGRHSTQ